MKYIVKQVKLVENSYEKTSSERSLSKLELIINEQCEKGYRLHSINSEPGKNIESGDVIRTILVFEAL